VEAFDIRKHIRIDGVSNGWIHTHGMVELGLPELEINDVPCILQEEAGRLINHVAAYMHEVKDSDHPVRLHQTMQISAHTCLRFAPAVPREDAINHYKADRWELVGVTRCPGCGAFHADGQSGKFHEEDEQ
jgi:hypothetical protein